MKKFFMISVLMGALPLSMVAQDDLYFVPKKKSAEVVEVTTPVYNRAKSQYEVIQNDSTIDIIEFDGQKGVYPDSIVTEDFELTKRMQRFDDYDLSDNAAFWAGYHLGRDTWNWGLSWHSPWYYSRFGWYGGIYDPWYYGYYDPWYYGYYGWRDPWYYSWYGGWYDPWYYGYYGWYGSWRYGYYGYYDLGYPYYTTGYYGGAPRRYSNNRVTGTQRHGRIDYSGPRGISNGRTTTYSGGTFGGSSLGGNRASNTRTTAATQGSTQRTTTVRNSSGTFAGNRANSTYSTNRSSGTFSNGNSTRTVSSGSSMSSSSGGSFGGSRSSGGGSIGGGSRSGGGGGGGGSFGGGRRR